MSDGEGPHAKRARQDGWTGSPCDPLAVELVDCRPYAKPGHSCGSCSHCLSADHSSSDEASDDDSDPEHVKPEHVMRARQEGWTGRFSDDGKAFLHADGGWTELEDCRPTAKPGHSSGSSSGSGSGSGSGAHAEPSSGSGSGSSSGFGFDFGAHAEPSTADLLARVATLEGLVARAAASVAGDTGVNGVAGYRFT